DTAANDATAACRAHVKLTQRPVRPHTILFAHAQASLIVFSRFPANGGARSRTRVVKSEFNRALGGKWLALLSAIAFHEFRLHSPEPAQEEQILALHPWALKARHGR